MVDEQLRLAINLGTLVTSLLAIGASMLLIVERKTKQQKRIKK